MYLGVFVKDNKEICAAYRDQLEILFKVRVCELIELARQLNKEHPRNFEFQMLMGAHDKRKEELAGEGYKVCGYIPYGKGWLGYFLCRLNEQKRDIRTALVCVLKGD